MTIEEILKLVVKKDAAIRAFSGSENNLPEAAKARIANTLANLERDLGGSEMDILESWVGNFWAGKSWVFAVWEGECSYYVFADGSLYFRSSGDSEVWSAASDFAVEKIINGYDGQLDSMDANLLRHLGGVYATEVEERGVRA